MENLNFETQNETPETGAEYLRRLAGDIRKAGQSATGAEYLRRLAGDIHEVGQNATAFDIEAAADKIDQQAREIETLAQRAIDRRQDEDRLAAALMAVIGDRLESLALQAAEQIARDAAKYEIENLDISDYEYEIGEMIDDRLPDAPDEDDQRESVEGIVREILAGATLTIDI